MKSLQNGSNLIVDRSRNEKQQDLRLSTNLTRVFVLYFPLPKVQNEDPFKIVSKSLQNGSNVILHRSKNKEQQDLRLPMNLTRVFVLYITLPKVQNEDPFKIVLKAKWLEHDCGPKQKQGTTRLTTKFAVILRNFTMAFVLCFTRLKVQIKSS